MNPTPRRLQPLCDKVGRARVETTLRAFYRRLFADPMLGGYFASLDFEAHLAHIIEFWWIAMGGKSERPPTFDMIGRHQPLGITRPELRHWLALFRQTLHEELPEELAVQWSTMAEGIAGRMTGIVKG